MAREPTNNPYKASEKTPKCREVSVHPPEVSMCGKSEASEEFPAARKDEQTFIDVLAKSKTAVQPTSKQNPGTGVWSI